MADTATEVKTETPAPKTEEQTNIELIQKSIDTGGFKLPAEFKTAEDFYKSHMDLRAHATKVSQENAELKKPKGEKTEEKKTETPPVTDLAAALNEKKGEATPSVWDQIDVELRDTDTISDASRKELTETLKVPNALIDSMIETNKHRKAKDAEEAAKLVGGNQKLTEVLKWGSTYLSEADKAVLQEQLRGKGWKLALMGLAKMAEKDLIKEPSNIDTTSAAGVGGALPFSNSAEMTVAIRDVRYMKQTDPNYVKLVDARIQATSKQAQANNRK